MLPRQNTTHFNAAPPLNDPPQKKTLFDFQWYLDIHFNHLIRFNSFSSSKNVI